MTSEPQPTPAPHESAPTQHVPPAHDPAGRPLAPVRLLVSEGEEIIDAVIFHLNFHPTESIVAVLLREGQMFLCARCDPDGEPQLRRQLAAVAVEHRADGLYLLVFSEAWTAEETAALADRFAVPGLPEPAATLLVTARTWQEVGAWEGPVLPRQTTVLAAEAIFAGLNPHRDRAAAVAAAAPPPPERWAELSALEPEARAVPGEPGELAIWVDDWLTDHAAAAAIDDAQAVRLAVLACDSLQRERVWRALDATTASTLIDCFARLVAVAVGATAVGPLCLLGMASWVAGSGALLVQCIERAEALAPDDLMVDNLRMLNEQALPPSVWDDLRREMFQKVSCSRR